MFEYVILEKCLNFGLNMSQVRGDDVQVKIEPIHLGHEKRLDLSIQDFCIQLITSIIYLRKRKRQLT